MDESLKEVRLVMVRPNWADLPEHPLPPGFAVRWYEPGDEARWLGIHLAAERQIRVTPELFRQQFGTDDALLGRRQCYLVSPHGEAVGTATAWFDETFRGGGWGRVHWVAVRPEYQGRGFGRALMSVVCRRLRELGHEAAFLRTTAGRERAINLYLAFGFVPMPQNKLDRRLWEALAPKLRYPVVL